MPMALPTPLSDAVRTCSSVIVESTAEMEERYPDLAAAAPHSDYGAWMAVPLCVEEFAIGVIGLSFSTDQPVSAVDRSFVAALAAQCTYALERARLYERGPNGST
jgi:GAF domain-containing protein